jgi:DNA polymerase-3 subunit alpha
MHNFEVCGFEHLHQHSDSSLLDGLAKVREYAERSKEINQQYLCITDHGVMGSVPQQIAECESKSLFPIFGCELYVNRYQIEAATREDSKAYRKSLDEGMQKKFDKNSHLLAIAYNNEGYKNLVTLTSWAWIYGYYKRPRVNHEILMKHKEGIIFTSTCANSEIANALFNDGEDAAFDMVEKYVAMFGKNFYLELMMLDFKLQKPYDAFLIKAHLKYNIPVFLSQDCHYCKKEHSKFQRYMLMMQNDRTIVEIEKMIAAGLADEIFELQDTNLWKKSEEELNEKWQSDYQDVIDYEIFKEAKRNTVRICELAKGVELDRTLKLPHIEEERKILREYMLEGFEVRRVPHQEIYKKRLMEEYNLICEKGFASYFLIQKMMVDEARRIAPELLGWGDGSEAVGPGRGSVCGSLLAYCIGLHDIDPIRHNLLFSRFLSPARGGLQMKTRFNKEPIHIDQKVA